MYTFFISYRWGTHYCAIYPDLKSVRQAIKYLLEYIESSDRVPTIRSMKAAIKSHDDFWTEFSDGTWIHVQPLSEFSVEVVKKFMNKEG